MFLFLKMVKPFFLPPTIIFVLLLLTWGAVWRRRRAWALTFLTSALMLYYVLSLEPVASGLARGLEGRYTTAIPERDTAEVIVVLGGGAIERGEDKLLRLSDASARRLQYAIELYHAFQGSIPIMYSGGSGDPFHPESREAAFAKNIAVAKGVSGDQFVVEPRSRTTRESGKAIRQWLQEQMPERAVHRIIVVTSAWHMPRAIRVMEREEIVAIAAPTDFSERVFDMTPLSFFPTADALSSSVMSVHEWLGIAGYWVLGRI